MAVPPQVGASQVRISMQAALCQSSSVLQRLLHHQTGLGLLCGHAGRVEVGEHVHAHQLQDLHRRAGRQRTPCRGQDGAVHLRRRGLLLRRSPAALASQPLPSRRPATRYMARRQRTVCAVHCIRERRGERCLQMQRVQHRQTYCGVLDHLLPPISTRRASSPCMEVHGMSVPKM